MKEAVLITSPKNFFALLPEGLTAEEKRQRLEAMAYNKFEDDYDVPLSEEEIQAAETQLAHAQVQIMTLQEAKKKAVAQYDGPIKTHQAESKELTMQLKARTRQEEGMVYEVINDEDGRTSMDLYTADGTLLYSRPLRPTEKQMHIGEAASMRLTK
jgi:hypothetical protein